MLNAQHRVRSVATLRGAKPDSSGDYTMGMKVGEHVLVELLPNAVRFARDGESCWLSMFGQNASDKIAVERANSRAQERAAKRKGGRPPHLASYPPPRALSAAEQSAAIAHSAEGKYVVDRALIGKALERWDGVEATTRIGKVPRAKKGLKLDGVRANGLLEALGLREGDVLRRANGRRVARIADLRRALTDLSEGEPIELDLERKGRRVELAYAAR